MDARRPPAPHGPLHATLTPVSSRDLSFPSRYARSIGDALRAVVARESASVPRGTMRNGRRVTQSAVETRRNAEKCAGTCFETSAHPRKRLAQRVFAERDALAHCVQIEVRSARSRSSRASWSASQAETRCSIFRSLSSSRRSARTGIRTLSNSRWTRSLSVAASARASAAGSARRGLAGRAREGSNLTSDQASELVYLGNLRIAGPRTLAGVPALCTRSTVPSS
jgi:hypothetical protein